MRPSTQIRLAPQGREPEGWTLCVGMGTGSAGALAVDPLVK